MAAVTIGSLVSFFAEEKRSITRGENHRSDHVESFAYADGVIGGTVHASMKNKSYNVTVSSRSSIVMCVKNLLLA